MLSEWARHQTKLHESAWQRQWPTIESLDEEQFEKQLPEGRTVKEVLAHIAFWEEAAVGYVLLVLRGQRLDPEDLRSVTDEEGAGDIGAYFERENPVEHLDEHLKEISQTIRTSPGEPTRC